MGQRVWSGGSNKGDPELCLITHTVHAWVRLPSQGGDRVRTFMVGVGGEGGDFFLSWKKGGEDG